MRCFVLLGIVPLVAAACFGGGGKAGGAAGKHPIVLSMASAISGGQPEQLVRFADEVARRSHGTLRIEFRQNWRAGDLRQEADTIADVRAGRVDLAWVGARAWDWVGIRTFDALVAPFLIDSHALEERVFEQRIPERMLSSVSHAGVVGIGVLPGPLRKLLGVRDPLLPLSDFRGRTIGVQGIVAAETVRALGARPRQVYAQTLLTGLDGIEEQLGAIVGNQHYRTAKYLSANLTLWPRPLVIVAGAKTFGSLALEQQRALRDGAVAAVAEAMAASRREDEGSAQSLCDAGLTFVDANRAQLAALRRAVAPVYRRLERDATTRRLIREIEALRRETPPDRPIRCARGAQAGAQQAASPIDGVWELSVGRDDLVGNPAYGHPPSEEDLRVDTGDYRLAVHRGTAEFSFDGPVSHSSDRATFSVHGDTVVFHITSGHDVGETWAYRWSVYRDTLTLRRPSPGYNVGPPNPMFAPWHRVGP